MVSGVWGEIISFFPFLCCFPIFALLSILSPPLLGNELFLFLCLLLNLFRFLSRWLVFCSLAELAELVLETLRMPF